MKLIPVDEQDELYPDAYLEGQAAIDDRTCLIYKPQCAIDGEGITLGPRHYYIELQAVWPQGRKIIKGSDLGPHEIFDFLFHLPEKHNYVVYGASYDFNMWLLHLPLETKIDLITTTEAFWGPYKLKWIDRKYLHIRRGRKYRIVYDVIAWYQRPFVQTLEAWSIGTSEEWAFISRMKAMRGNFADVDPQEIERYCWLECELLVKLVDSLCQAMQDTPYRPRALYGPGALAEAIFRYHKIKTFDGPYDEELALKAYYGGRFDTAFFGWFENVHEYDIRSAYPDQIRNLPCLAHGRWANSKSPFKYKDGIFRVKWDVGINCLYPPFPYRDRTGCIWYLYAGQGWYHADEVRAAIEVFGDAVKVMEGTVWVQECQHQPFQFVEDLYKWRLKIAKENYAKGQIVKLGLNSMYGKLVQSVGNRKSKPPFQNFFWGGAITAGTRAKILRVIGPKMDQIVSIATDGIISREQLDVIIGKELGEWEYSELLEHVQLSNGVYHSIDNEGIVKERARGIGHGEIDWQELKLIYQEKGIGGSYSYTRKSRFITIREALHLNQPDIACTWREEERVLTFDPKRMEVTGLNVEGKEPPLGPDDLLQFRGVRYSSADLVDIQKRIPHKTTLSYPFRKKHSWQEQLELRDFYRQRGQLESDLL
jgi:DNA polymerase type B, organellar and viral